MFEFKAFLGIFNTLRISINIRPNYNCNRNRRKKYKDNGCANTVDPPFILVNRINQVLDFLLLLILRFFLRLFFCLCRLRFFLGIFLLLFCRSCFIFRRFLFLCLFLLRGFPPFFFLLCVLSLRVRDDLFLHLCYFFLSPLRTDIAKDPL